MRLTKIIATLGPATAGSLALASLVRAGADVARLNMSHGSHAQHAKVIAALRKTSVETGRAVAIVADLQGPKARIGRLEGGGPVRLRAGETLRLTPRDILGSPGLLPTSYRRLARDVSPGDPILLDDGLIELKVLCRRGEQVRCLVVTGGLLQERKGMNLPMTRIQGPSLTRKDLSDLDFAVRHRLDYVAVSFVRRAADVERVRRILTRRGSRIPLIAKLELRAAVDHLDGILEVADGVMVARGDLGVEVPLESVPVLQKRIVERANRAGVLVITATQMLESMVRHPRPTRAEASDVANAIFDGSDAVMLSAETAAGHYPVKAVAVMDRIAREAEKCIVEQERSPDLNPMQGDAVHAVAAAACGAVRMSGAQAIVVYTQTGATARILSKLKPPCAIIALTPTERVRRRMALYRGVHPLSMPLARSTDRMLSDGDRRILREGLLSAGQRAILVSGTSPRSGATNLMKIHRVGGPV